MVPRSDRVAATWRWLRWGLLAAGVIVVLLGADLAWRVHKVSEDVRGLPAQVRELNDLATQPGAAAAARRQLLLVQLQHASSAARGHVGSLEWRLGTKVPFAGGALGDARTLVQVADSLDHDALPQILSVGQAVLDASTADRATPVKALADALPALDRSAGQIDHDLVRLDGLHDDTVGALTRARQQFLTKLTDVQEQLRGLRVTATVAPGLFGLDSDRHALIVLQQTAESRATGGLDGGVVSLTVHLGSTHIDEVTGKLPDSATDVVSVDADYSAQYGPYRAMKTAAYSNLSPDFPVVAATWAGLWGTDHAHVDEVIGVTPAVLDRILGAIGPITLGDGTTFKAGQVAAFAAVGLYEKYPRLEDEPQRQAYQNELLRAIVQRLQTTDVSLRALREPMAAAARAGEVRLWSADPTTEAALLGTQVGGALPSAPGPYVGVLTQNFGGTKLDAYLDRAIHYVRTPDAPGKDRVTVTETLTNHAAAQGLPPYVTYRADLGAAKAQSRPGETRLRISTYLSTDATDATITVGGKKPAFVGIDHEKGHLVVTTVATIAPGAHLDVVVTATEAHAADPAPVRLEQPGSRTTWSVG